MADIAQLAIKVDSSGVVRATNDLKGMQTASTGAAKSADALTSAGKNTAFQMRQTAMQLSQVASQGAVTGNYIQALAIQLPDLALALGPVGILAGALAGALAGPLINALSNSSRSIENLTDVIGKLGSVFDEAADGSFKFSEELVRMARVSEEIARLKVASGVEEARRSILAVGESLNETYADIKDTLSLTVDEAARLSEAVSKAAQSKNISDYNNLASVIADLETKYQAATVAARENLESLRAAGASNVIERKRIQAASDEYIRLRNALNGVRGEFTDLIQTGAEATIVFDRLTGAADNFDSLLERSSSEGAINSFGYAVTNQMRLMRESVDQTQDKFREFMQLSKELEDAQKRFSSLITADVTSQFEPDQIAAQRLASAMQEYQSLLDMKLISDEQYQEGRIAAEERYYARIAELREEDRANQLGFNDNTLSAFGTMVGNLAEIAAMGGEEQFNTWKRLAQAQAGISGAMAVLSVLGDPTVPAPLKPALAASFGVLAAAQIAQIEQQEYQAREYGGQVSAGSSYLVGERGPELITIGSQGGMVTPNKDLKSGGDTTVVFQISTGVQSTVRAEMMSMMPTIIKTAQKVAGAQRR